MSLLTLVSLVVTGCALGPEEVSPSLSSADREQKILAIADAYAMTGDLDAAKAELQELNLTDPEQLVLSMAESYLLADESPDVVVELVGLAQALGPISRLASEYMAEHDGEDAASVALAPALAPTPEPSATPTPEPPTATPEPTATPTEVPDPTATPTDTPIPVPRVAADSQGLNVRSGPGTLYPVVGSMRQGEEADIVASSPDGGWWQVSLADGSQGWISASLVTASGPIDAVAVAQNIAPPPATPTPLPPPKPTTPPRPAVDFKVVKQRMLTIQENGGCAGNHNIFVQVVDINGNPLNGVTVKRVWAGIEKVSGSKPDDYLTRPAAGWLQFDLYKNGDQAVVVRDADGRAVVSETTRSLEVEDEKISIDELIANGYCSNSSECQTLVNENRLCRFHYSYEVVFQRQY